MNVLKLPICGIGSIGKAIFWYMVGVTKIRKMSYPSPHLNSKVNEAPNSKKSGEGGDIENCNFKLISQNVKGLKTDKVKRETVFNYLKENGDIAFLQETHSTIDA